MAGAATRSRVQPAYLALRSHEEVHALDIAVAEGAWSRDLACARARVGAPEGLRTVPAPPLLFEHVEILQSPRAIQTH